MEIVSTAEAIDGGKVAVLDFGGTLAKRVGIGSVHEEYNRSFGLSPREDKELYDGNRDETGIDHLGHVAEQTRKIKEKLNGDPADEIFVDTTEYILEKTEIMEGAHEFVDELEGEGFTTVILSSSPPAAVLPFAGRLDVDHVYVWKDYEFDEDGGFQHVYVNPEACEGKHKVVEELQEEGTVAHFGNGKNDEIALSQADIGVRRGRGQQPQDFYDEAIQEVREHAN